MKKRIRDTKTSVWRKQKYSLLEAGLCMCTKCKAIKELNFENFSVRKDNKTGFSSWCRKCQAEHAKKKMQIRRDDPIQKVIVKSIKYKHAKSEKGRAGKRRSSAIRNQKKRSLIFIWTAKNWDDCKAYFENKCAYCQSEEALTQDHFIPLSNENCPGTIVSNMLPACNYCNCSKHNKDPQIWCSPEALERIQIYFDYINKAA